MNLDEEVAESVIQAAQDKADQMAANAEITDTEEYRIEDASAAPVEVAEVDETPADSERQRRIDMFMQLSGVGDAAAHALADAGYKTIGDIIADHAEEVAGKTGLPLGVAKTVQIAADRFLQG